ncbi:MAG: PilZ domain-containing protein [Gammaproteobacteria bacterium]|jgi:hypothetical protein
MAKLTLSIDNRSPQAWLLTGEELRIGADPTCDIHIDNVYLQPHHASIRPFGGGYLLTATRSGNALQVNHVLAREHILRDGDVIQLASSRLVFTDAAAASPAAGSPAAERAGSLRILGRRHQGRIIRLDNPVTRFGKTGVMAAMISRRSDGYYLAHLEGEEFPVINRRTIGERACRLRDGDRIGIGELEFEFLQGMRHIPAAAQPVPGTVSDRQRHFTRVALQIPATIGSDASRWETRLIDLSLSGALLEYPRDWPGDTGGLFTLKLSQPVPPPSGLPVEVRQIKQDRIGVAFVDLDEAGSEQVRRLVEANLGDPALLHREILELS